MTYEPKPIDTTDVVMTRELAELTEMLAKNAHDIWAKQRIGDGWQYGPQRDDAKKQHPCLVPYHDLTESEKDYDRKMALETLKLIQTLGYRIVK